VTDRERKPADQAAREELLTVKDVAALLRISPGSVYHWLGQQRLPCVRFSKRCVRFRSSEILALVKSLSEEAKTELPHGLA
jgi:excisionase family DNA binding protein